MFGFVFGFFGGVLRCLQLIDDPVGSEIPKPAWVPVTPVSSEPALRRVRLTALTARPTAMDDAMVVCRYGSAGLLVLASDDLLTLCTWDGTVGKRYSFGALVGPPSRRLFPGWIRTMVTCRVTKLLVALLSTGQVMALPLVSHDATKPSSSSAAAAPPAPAPAPAPSRAGAGGDATLQVAAPLLDPSQPLTARHHRRPVLLDLQTDGAFATSLAFSPWGGVLAVGLAAGTVLSFHFETRRVAVRRKSKSLAVHPHTVVKTRAVMSLAPWGFTSAHTGPVRALAWDGLGHVLAVGHAKSGITVWSHSGTRVFTSLPESGPELLESADRPPGVVSLAWTNNGFTLTAVPALAPSPVSALNALPWRIALTLAPSPSLVSYAFMVAASRMPGASGPSAALWLVTPTALSMLRPSTGSNTLTGRPVSDAEHAACLPGGAGSDEGAADARNDADGTDTLDLRWQAVTVHPSYTSSNAPLTVFSCCDSHKVVVAGWRGFTVLDARMEKWRLFGDIHDVSCVGGGGRSAGVRSRLRAVNHGVCLCVSVCVCVCVSVSMHAGTGVSVD